MPRTSTKQLVIPVIALLSVVAALHTAAAQHDDDRQEQSPLLSGDSSYRFWTEASISGDDTLQVPYVHIINTRFRIAAQDLVLKETLDTRDCLFNRSNSASVTAEMWAMGPVPDPTEPMWRLETWGTETDIVDQGFAGSMYRVISGGCCSDRSAHTFYDLRSGKEQFRCDGTYLRLDVPNSMLRRFVTVTVPYHDRQEQRLSDPHAVARIEYGERPGYRSCVIRIPGRYRAERCSLQFIENESSDKDWADWIANNVLTLWSADKSVDPASIGGFSIRVVLPTHDMVGVDSATMSPTFTVEIPVEGDSLRPELAVCSDGASVLPGD